jgi:hypothetical protein
MIHKAAWFEMLDKRKPRFATASWVPLFARQQTSELRIAEPGHWQETFDAMAISLPAESAGLVAEIEWFELSASGNRPQVEGDCFLPASRFVHFKSDIEGDYLVLHNWFETGDEEQFILDPDLILGLRLRQEGECWVAPYEDYVPVIRSHKRPNGRMDLIEIRAEYLRDYLCARGRGLLIATFRSRREVSAVRPEFELAPSWDEEGGHWEGQISEDDSDGGEYGSNVALLEMGRTDVDLDADVPVMGFPGGN